jgi:hypothetical protein
MSGASGQVQRITRSFTCSHCRSALAGKRKRYLESHRDVHFNRTDLDPSFSSTAILVRGMHHGSYTALHTVKTILCSLRDVL